MGRPSGRDIMDRILLRSPVDSLLPHVMPDASAKRYRHAPDVDGSVVGERAVLYHRPSGTAVVLNPTGSWLWELLTACPTPQALAEQLRAKCPALTGEQAVRDVSIFLEALCQHGMVLDEEGPGPEMARGGDR
jgi:Coenzyme PQQ synthesis protein D (PqqD)